MATSRDSAAGSEARAQAEAVLTATPGLRGEVVDLEQAAELAA